MFYLYSPVWDPYTSQITAGIVFTQRNYTNELHYSAHFRLASEDYAS